MFKLDSLCILILLIKRPKYRKSSLVEDTQERRICTINSKIFSLIQEYKQLLPQNNPRHNVFFKLEKVSTYLPTMYK